MKEAVKHNTAKLDETLTKVELLILISKFTYSLTILINHNCLIAI